MRFHDLRLETVTRLFEKVLNPIEVGVQRPQDAFNVATVHTYSLSGSSIKVGIKKYLTLTLNKGGGIYSYKSTVNLWSVSKLGGGSVHTLPGLNQGVLTNDIFLD